MKTESIVGKTYIPHDNSYCVNLTSSSNYPYKSETSARLAGTRIGDEPKECIILTEPFMCKILSVNGIIKEIEMILVNYNNSTYSIMYYSGGVRP